jgi:hypothetical protein
VQAVTSATDSLRPFTLATERRIKLLFPYFYDSCYGEWA